MYDTNFAIAGSFTDPNIPSGFAPFGIANIGGKLFVTFAKQDAAKHDDVKGAGNGYVDVFNPDGSLSARLISRGPLNSPWGLAIAPSSFGTFAGDLLVGNFGDGRINVFSLSGTSLGTLSSSSDPIAIDGLWGLAVGNGGSAGLSTSVYFTAGPNNEENGLLGSLSAAP
jgi:uncharacterized protein (TIGR03118 family)